MRKKWQLFLIAFALTVVFSKEHYDYCRIPSCIPYSHVFCRYQTPYISNKCGDVTSSHVTLDEKVLILNLHNHFRWLVYTGQEERGINGPQPAAANVTYLEWDTELEEIAQRWAVQCLKGDAECRDVERFPVNQLYGSDKNRNTIKDLSIEAILWYWYSEVITFDSGEVQHFNENTAHFWHTYHYTQMVWETTKKIGCSTIRYSDSRYYRLKLVCNYGPRGNNPGQPVYKLNNIENPSLK